VDGGCGRRIVARGTRVTTWYARQFGRLIKFGSERSLAVARTVNALTGADELPGPSDFEAEQKPVGRAWVRRVGRRRSMDARASAQPPCRTGQPLPAPRESTRKPHVPGRQAQGRTQGTEEESLTSRQPRQTVRLSSSAFASLSTSVWPISPNEYPT